MTLLAIIQIAAVTVLSESNATMPFANDLPSSSNRQQACEKEQRCSGYDNSRPGDIFHPDFLLGHPSFFDVTVSNSLQPSFIIEAASNAGAAAEAAEACKDFLHADRVTATGNIFYPLAAVETLSLWTPYSLKILRLIASRISAMSHMIFSKLNNLLQQLSVILCLYNARLVLRLNLEIEDVRSWDMHT